MLDKRQSDLWDAIVASGLCLGDRNSARIMVNRLVKKGLFVYPADKTSRKYSQKMIDDIIKSFSPGGKMFWSIEDYA